MDQTPYVYTILIPQKIVCANYNKIINSLLYHGVNINAGADLRDLIEEYTNPSMIPKTLPDEYPDRFQLFSYNYKALTNFKNSFASHLKIVRFWNVVIQQ